MDFIPINTFIYLIQAIYVIYMLNWFKTTWNFAHPLTEFNSDYLAHPVHKLNSPINPVCKLGNNLSWLLAGYLISWGIYLDNNKPASTFANYLHIGVLFLTFVLSLLNFNVTFYLLPIIFFGIIYLSRPFV